jgi:hypothetical protein
MRLGLHAVGSVRERRERQIATVGRTAGTGGKRPFNETFNNWPFEGSRRFETVRAGLRPTARL